jgi:hypothetical protein
MSSWRLAPHDDAIIQTPEGDHIAEFANPSYAKIAMRSINAFNRAGSELGLDPAELAKELDLAALIRAAVVVRVTLHDLSDNAGAAPEWNKDGHAYEASKLLNTALIPFRNVASLITGGAKPPTGLTYKLKAGAKDQPARPVPLPEPQSLADVKKRGMRL